MIRRAKTEDSMLIASLNVRGWQTAYKGLIDDIFLNSLDINKASKGWKEKIASQNDNNHYFVYEEDNKILGVIRFGMPDNTYNKYNAEIHVLYVEPDLKRKGIGTKLFNYAKRYFLKNGKQDLIIWCLKGNEPAINFYKKQGGRISQQRKTIVNNVEVEELGIEYKLEYDICLVKPTKDHEAQVIEYKKEHYDNGEKKIHACSRLDKLDSYDEWLELLDKCSKKETVSDDWTVSTQFLGVRKKDNRIVGMISIRHALTTDFLRNYAGHIGYGIRPSERKKGYITQILDQALNYCKNEIKLDKVMISCDRKNEASRRTILSAGGVLEKEYTTKDRRGCSNILD